MTDKDLKHFWRKDGADYIADIGTRPSAVVVAYYVGGYYKISNRSYFFFPNDYYHRKFLTPYEAIELAESYIKDWVLSLLVPPADLKTINESKVLGEFVASEITNSKIPPYAELLALHFISKNCHSLTINVSDFFDYACADSVEIDADYLKWIMPIVVKYPCAGLDAAMSFIANRTPISPFVTEEFKQALAEIQLLNPEIGRD